MARGDTHGRQPRGLTPRQATREAASECFRERGVEGARLDLVIARSGGSRRTSVSVSANLNGCSRPLEGFLERIPSRLGGFAVSPRPPKTARH